MSHALSSEALETLFTGARTHSAWLDKPVSDAQLADIYNLLRLGPTSANCSPARFLFVRSPEAKARLKAALSSGNIDKTMSAPVTAIVAWDPAFFEQLPTLFPYADARAWFTSSPELAEETVFRNSSMQAAYLIAACRALGFDTGPMSGFDREKVDTEFFSANGWKSNLLINIGYGDPEKAHTRLPRLAFEAACRVV